MQDFTPILEHSKTFPTKHKSDDAFLGSQAVREASAENTKKSGALGISAKFSSTPDFIGFQASGVIDTTTGEVVPLKPDKNNRLVKLERFALQASARAILKYSRVSRVARCLRVVSKNPNLEHKNCVTVLKSKEHGTCSYSGLQTCGSVWVCPVCAAKITERRRIEVLQAINSHQANSGHVYLLTLTTPHYLNDSLTKVIDGQIKALSYFNGDRAGKLLFHNHGIIGQIRALELTHGRLRQNNNGWHPHHHILLFSALEVDLMTLSNELYLRWVHCCLKAGLNAPNRKNGLTLAHGSNAAHYVAKMGLEAAKSPTWGLDSEMTKGHVKKSTGNGETPFDFLRSYLFDKDKQAAALFKEFALVFKGKKQLIWSRGLKKLFNVTESTDEELTAIQDDSAFVLGQIELDDWQLILKHDLRGEILELACHGWEPVDRLINSLRVSTCR